MSGIRLWADYSGPGWPYLFACILFPGHWRADVTLMNDTVDSSVKGFKLQHLAGKSGQ